MHRVAFGKVGNLVAATGAAGDDGGFWGGRPHGGEQAVLADGAADLEMVDLVAKVTGHPATAAGDDRYIITGQPQRRHAGFVADQRFMVTMAVEQRLPRLGAPPRGKAT